MPDIEPSNVLPPIIKAETEISAALELQNPYIHITLTEPSLKPSTSSCKTLSNPKASTVS